SARDSGEVRLSAPVELIQRGGDGSRSGLLMYAPIYANGIQPTNPTARRTAMSGWVYAPFHTRTMIDGALQQLIAGQVLRIVDTGEGAGDELVYADPGFTDDPDADVLRHSETVALHGRQWRACLQSRPSAAGVSCPAGRQAAGGAGLTVPLVPLAVGRAP